MWILFALVVCVVTAIYYYSSLPDKAKNESINNSENDNEDFKFLGAKKYEHAVYFRYSVNRKYKKLADELKVKGISNYRKAAEQFFGSEYKKLILEREPNNPNDPKAIKVLGNNLLMGYVPRENASQLAKLMDKGIQIEVLIEGMSSYPKDYGCNLGVVFSVWVEKEKLAIEGQLT